MVFSPSSFSPWVNLQVKAVLFGREGLKGLNFHVSSLYVRVCMRGRM